MADRMSSRGASNNQTYKPTPNETKILTSLARFHYLTVKQVVRLFELKSTEHNENGIQRHFKRLTDEGFCIARRMDREGPSGSGAQIFALGTKGRNHVASLDVPVPPRFRPSDVPTNDNQLRHVAACSDVFITAELFCRHNRRFTLERLVHEREFRSVKSYVELDGRRTAVIPDGWFSIADHSEGYRSPIAFEVDRSSEKQGKWRAKVAALVAWIDGPYAARMGVESVRVAVVTPGRPRRAATLRAWTEAELVAEGRREDGALFRFTGLDPTAADPATFFLGLVWQEPFQPELRPLLETERGDG